MAIYVGEAVTIIASAINPAKATVISDATASVEFFAPGKAPKTVPGDRVPDVGPLALTFDAAVVNKDASLGAYVGSVDTAGWAAGKWTYRAILSGVFDSWEYGSFTLVG